MGVDINENTRRKVSSPRRGERERSWRTSSLSGETILVLAPTPVPEFGGRGFDIGAAGRAKARSVRGKTAYLSSCWRGGGFLRLGGGRDHLARRPRLPICGASVGPRAKTPLRRWNLGTTRLAEIKHSLWAPPRFLSNIEPWFLTTGFRTREFSAPQSSFTPRRARPPTMVLPLIGSDSFPRTKRFDARDRLALVHNAKRRTTGVRPLPGCSFSPRR